MVNRNRPHTEFHHRWNICTAFLIILSLYFWIFIFNYDEWSKFQFLLKRRPKSLETEDDSEILNLVTQFRKTWNDVIESRLLPRKVIGNCATTWTNAGAIPWEQKPERTCEKHSFISNWGIRPAGEFSTINVQTVFINKSLKLFGGDFWRVTISGKSSIPVTKTDLGNGSYEFKFLTMIAGQHKIKISLEYTLCDGIKEPPPYWFLKGNLHGKEQHQGTLRNDSPYINKRLWNGAELNLYIPPNRLTHDDKAVMSKDMCEMPYKKCHYLWNDYGSWFNTTWQPFCPDIPIRYPHDRQGILWIFGDSVATQFYHRVKFSRLCKKIFKTCMYTYNWIYSLQNYNITLNSYTIKNSSHEKTTYDGLDFNLTRVIVELEQAVFHPNMDNDSVILFNYGLHFTEATNFTNFKRLIKSVIKFRKGLSCKMIWRTITSLNRHKYRRPNLHSRRFMTSQRVLFYNAYATREFCKAGFDIIDVYSITDAYPYGTGSKKTPGDPVHYEYHVMQPLEHMLERVFEPDSRNNGTFE